MSQCECTSCLCTHYTPSKPVIDVMNDIAPRCTDEARTEVEGWSERPTLHMCRECAECWENM